MFRLALGFSIVFSMSLSFAEAWARAPDQGLVDQYIATALQFDPAKFEQKGRFTCEYQLADEPFSASADDLVQASQLLLLRCIQYQCANLHSKITKAQEKILAIEDQVLRDYMHSQGFSQDQIDNAISIKNGSNSIFPNVTCENATPLARRFVFDSCVPQKCTRSKSRQ